MLLSIDFDSEEAIYMQIRNQIILGIATDRIKEGESLPSVRQMAELVGINMHTVNKAYAVLKAEGFLTLDRRKGAVVALDIDKIKALKELDEDLRIVLAKAICKRVSAEEAHALVDRIYRDYQISEMTEDDEEW